MKYNSLIILLICISFVSCRTWDEEFNTDPNRPNIKIEQSVNPDDWIGPMIDGTYNYSRPAIDVIAPIARYNGKYSALSQANRHRAWHDLDGNIWPKTYLSLQPIKNLRNTAKSAEHKNYEAIANIWQSYIFLTLTNTTGHIPYFDVIGDFPKNLAKYDDQKLIYYDILEVLKKANDLISTNGKQVKASNDYIYGGDVTKWKKLANTLRLKMALYMYNADPEKAKQIANEIVNNQAQYPIFQGNEDNFAIHYDRIDRKSPWYNDTEFLTIRHRLSNVFVERLVTLKDARLPKYAYPVKAVHTDPNKYVLPTNAGPQKYLGQLYGITTGDGDARVWNEGLDYASHMGPSFIILEEDGKTPNIATAEKPFTISTYSEILFVLAEMKYRNIISGGSSAEEYYKAAIKASFNMHACKWNGSAEYDGAFKNTAKNEAGFASADEYIAQPSVNWNGKRDKKLLLAEQKWIAIYNQGFEPFWEVRRTMLPKFPVSNRNEGYESSGSGTQFPSRTGYPSSESAENTVNYNYARSSMYDIPITGDADRNEAKMWLINNASSPSLEMRDYMFTEPLINQGQYPGGANFKAWYDSEWNKMMWWLHE